MIPDYLEYVEAAQVKYADAWTHAHVDGDPRRLEWIKLFAKDLRKKDPKVGANGKRGNPNDLSADAINILCDKADSKGRTPDGLPCVVVDVIGGAGGPNPTPAWNVYDTLIEGSGANVDPGATVPIPQPPQAPVQPYPNEPAWWGKVFTPAVVALYNEAGRTFPDHGDDSATLDGFRHWSRTSYDIRDGMTKEAALAKRLKELRGELGLPPV